MSRQRQVILSELRKLKTHPTADDLYLIIKKIMPNISLGTVYRNLNLLAEQGVILKLENAGTIKRFDGNAIKHYHFRCKKCHEIIDIMPDEISLLKKPIKDIKGNKLLNNILRHAMVTGLIIFGIVTLMTIYLIGIWES